MSSAAPLDTTIEVITPENIAFRYQLAGPFRRMPAFLIDIALKLLVAFGVAMLFFFFGVGAGNTTLLVFGVAALNVAWFLWSWFYGVFCETWFNGRTVGKWAMGIRVVGSDGHPITGMQAMLRNLLVVADLAPPVSLQFLGEDNPPVYMIPTGIVALVVMLCTRRMQRLGDLAAGTMVVIDERGWTLPISKVDDERVPALASYIPPSYRVSQSMAKTLALYAQRRTFLSPARRNELARHLTDPLIDQFEFRPDIDPDLLMYALYYHAFLADSRETEPDLGALAGFSPLRKDIDKPVVAASTQPTAIRSMTGSDARNSAVAAMASASTGGGDQSAPSPQPPTSGGTSDPKTDSTGEQL